MSKINLAESAANRSRVIELAEQGYSNKEIIEITQLSHNTVNSIIFRERKNDKPQPGMFKLNEHENWLV